MQFVAGSVYCSRILPMLASIAGRKTAPSYRCSV